MGAGYSAPTDTKTPTVLNFILREMFSRADLVDIYSLADPNRCGKYIVVAADALETLFVKIRLDPAATKEGALYFQSIDGLTKGTSLAALGAQDKRRIYCKQIAFFFVRIFQVFAALTLTILDSELPAVDPSDVIPTEEARQRRATFIDPRTFLGVTQAAKQRGGGLKGTPYAITSRPYDILNRYLDSPTDTETPMRFSSTSSLLIPQNSLYLTENGERKPIPDLKFVLVRFRFEQAGREQRIEAPLVLDGADDKLRVTLGPFASEDNGQQKRAPQLQGEFRWSQSSEEWLYSSVELLDIANKPLPSFLRKAFEEAVKRIYGQPPVDLLRLFRDWGLLESTDKYGRFRIAGTKFYTTSAPDSKEVLTLTYKGSVKFPGDTTQTTVTISGIRFGFPPNDPNRVGTEEGQKTYMLKLDFSNASKSTSPAGSESAFDLPSETRAKKFVLPKWGYGTPYTTDVKPRSISVYLESKMEAILQNKDEDLPDGTGIQYTRQGLPIPHNSESMDGNFRIKALWKALAKDPPIKSHCVARATQLLSVAAIRGKIDEGTFTQACRTTFLYQKDGSLPTPGDSIFKTAKEAVAPGKTFQGEYGILALATLFVERLGADGMPQLADTNKYKSFLANLKFAFEKTKAVDLQNPPATLADIRERLPGGVCEGERADKRLLVPSAVASGLQSVTRQLMSQQVSHVGKAMDLIFELFDKDAVLGRRQFALHPNILKGGTPAVNTVAAKARDLLLKYYTDCELTYRKGLGLIVNADRAQALKIAPGQ